MPTLYHLTGCLSDSGPRCSLEQSSDSYQDGSVATSTGNLTASYTTHSKEITMTTCARLLLSWQDIHVQFSPAACHFPNISVLHCLVVCDQWRKQHLPNWSEPQVPSSSAGPFSSAMSSCTAEAKLQLLILACMPWRSYPFSTGLQTETSYWIT